MKSKIGGVRTTTPLRGVVLRVAEMIKTGDFTLRYRFILKNYAIRLKSRPGPKKWLACIYIYIRTDTYLPKF